MLTSVDSELMLTGTIAKYTLNRSFAYFNGLIKGGRVKGLQNKVYI